MLQDHRDAAAAGKEIAALAENVSDIAPGFVRYLLAYPFGDSRAAAELDVRARELATVAGLTVLGSDRQLRIHIDRALEFGWSRAAIVETITEMADYAGITAALNALDVAKQVFVRRDKDEPASWFD